MAATLFGLTIFLIFAGFIAFVLRAIYTIRRKVLVAHARVGNGDHEDGDGVEGFVAHSDAAFSYGQHKLDSYKVGSQSGEECHSSFGGSNPSTGLPMMAGTMMDVGGNHYGR